MDNKRLPATMGAAIMPFLVSIMVSFLVLPQAATSTNYFIILMNLGLICIEVSIMTDPSPIPDNMNINPFVSVCSSCRFHPAHGSVVMPLHQMTFLGILFVAGSLSLTLWVASSL